MDVWRIEDQIPPCRQCGAPSSRHLASFPVVHDDSIPGGIQIRHGLVNDDGSPRTFYSKSEIARAAKEKGLRSSVHHVPNPFSGSDKSTHTQRFI
jgi:hypothetical protein